MLQTLSQVGLPFHPVYTHGYTIIYSILQFFLLYFKINFIFPKEFLSKGFDPWF